MLKKINRLKRKKDFEEIFQNGKALRNSFLVLKLKKNTVKDSRFAFVVSQKVSKKAVERNKIRRRMSEIIKVEVKNIKTGTDFVFIVTPAAKGKDFSQFKDAVIGLLIKSKCLNV
jgi:ribonuclease P protein component